MMRGKRGVVRGFASTLLAMLSGLVPRSVLAQIHRRVAEPESGK